MKNFLLLTLLILAALVGCKKQPEMDSNLLVITAVKSDFDTKATETAFEVGDTIGLYVNENVGNLPYETLDGISWKCLGFLGEFLAGKEYFATAYYPYSESATNPSAIEVSSGIDFMVSAKTKLDISGNAASGTLQFKHVLSKLVANIDMPEEIDGVKTVSLDSVRIKNVFRKGVINLATGVISGLTDKGDIASATNEIIVIPQTAPKIEFVFKMANGKFFKLAYNDGILLESGKKTTLNAHSNADLYFNSVLDLKNGDAQKDLPLSIFVATGRAWELKSSAPWLTFSKTSGVGKGIETVNVTVTANTTAPYAPRTAKLTLTDKTRNTAVSRTVMQNYSKLELSAYTPNEFVPKAGKSYTVNIISNKPWSVTAKTNVTVFPESGLGSTMVTITVPATGVDASRDVSATFAITGGGITRTWSTIQAPRNIITTTIGGTRWTSTNLTAAAQGHTSGFTIAVNPQDYGYFWKWGSKFAYDRIGGAFPEGHWGGETNAAATQPTIPSLGYDYTSASGIATAGDPCKVLGINYRTPTSAQITELVASGKSTWTTYQGVNGYFFGVKATYCNNTTIQDGCVFLPTAGARHCLNGSLIDETMIGYYWSSSVFDANKSPSLDLYSNGGIYPRNGNWRGSGLSVRCVQE